MKNINQIQRHDRSSQIPIGSKGVIDKLFASIKVAYPHFMKGQDEGDLKRMWFLHLKDFPDNRVEAGAFEMIDRFPKFPPTIGEFKGLLRDLNKVKPGLMIGNDREETCPNCRATWNSAVHQQECKK